MAVYKKTYRPYDGAMTAGWSRFLVIPRYSFEDLHRSRFLTIFFLASFIYPLICALIIYVQHNASVLALFGAQVARNLISINTTFFMALLGMTVFSVMALHAGIIPPTINLEQPGEGCDLDYVPNVAREKQIDIAVSNGFGFGGTNGTLVFRRL